MTRPTTHILRIALAVGAVFVFACTPGDHSVADSSVATFLDLGNADTGRDLVARAGCGACHVIPGVSDANGHVGPSLAHVAHRGYIAGMLLNTPSALVEWLISPQSIKPGNAMPDIGLSRKEASDIAAYLYTLQ